MSELEAQMVVEFEKEYGECKRQFTLTKRADVRERMWNRMKVIESSVDTLKGNSIGKMMAKYGGYDEETLQDFYEQELKRRG